MHQYAFPEILQDVLNIQMENIWLTTFMLDKSSAIMPFVLNNVIYLPSAKAYFNERDENTM